MSWTAPREVLIPSGTSIFEVVSMIILRADVLGVKLLNSADDVLAAIRSTWKAKIQRSSLDFGGQSGDSNGWFTANQEDCLNHQDRATSQD